MLAVLLHRDVHKTRIISHLLHSCDTKAVSLLAKPVSCIHSIQYPPTKIKRFFCHFFIVFHPQATLPPLLETLSLPIFQRFRPIFVRAYNAKIFIKILCTFSVSGLIWQGFPPISSAHPNSLHLPLPRENNRKRHPPHFRGKHRTVSPLQAALQRSILPATHAIVHEERNHPL